MAQAVQVYPSASGLLFGVQAYADIPGCYVALLTGSGWIFVQFSAGLINTYAGPNICAMVVKIDGIESQLLQRNAKPLEGEDFTMSHRIAIKLGSGQHIFQLRGYAGSANILIQAYQASLIVEEPGY